jgi:hypothetical protein
MWNEVITTRFEIKFIQSSFLWVQGRDDDNLLKWTFDGKHLKERSNRKLVRRFQDVYPGVPALQFVTSRQCLCAYASVGLYTDMSLTLAKTTFTGFRLPASCNVSPWTVATSICYVKYRTIRAITISTYPTPIVDQGMYSILIAI